MTNKILEIPDYTDDQIEEIIKKVEEAKPWTCDWVRRSEIFLLSVCTNTIFTFLGLHLSVLLWFAYPEIIHKYGVMMGYNNMTIMSCVPIVITFLLIDVYLYFYPSQFDKMTVREWCHLVLKKQDFGKRISYISFYGFFLLGIISLTISFSLFKATPILFLLFLLFIINLSFMYRNMDIIFTLINEKNCHRAFRQIFVVDFLLSYIPINLGAHIINCVLISVVNILFLSIPLIVSIGNNNFFYDIRNILMHLILVLGMFFYSSFKRTFKIFNVIFTLKESV